MNRIGWIVLAALFIASTLPARSAEPGGDTLYYNDRIMLCSDMGMCLLVENQQIFVRAVPVTTATELSFAPMEVGRAGPVRFGDLVKIQYQGRAFDRGIISIRAGSTISLDHNEHGTAYSTWKIVDAQKPFVVDTRIVTSADTIGLFCEMSSVHLAVDLHQGYLIGMPDLNSIPGFMTAYWRVNPSVGARVRSIHQSSASDWRKVLEFWYDERTNEIVVPEIYRMKIRFRDKLDGDPYVLDIKQRGTEFSISR